MAAVSRDILRGRGCGGKRPCLPCLERKRSAALCLFTRCPVFFPVQKQIWVARD